jgi:hypothetical protein
MHHGGTEEMDRSSILSLAASITIEDQLRTVHCDESASPFMAKGNLFGIDQRPPRPMFPMERKEASHEK